MGLEYMYHKTGDALAMGCKKIIEVNMGQYDFKKSGVKIRGQNQGLNQGSKYISYSGSRPFFIAFCLNCCFCLSLSSLSFKKEPFCNLFLENVLWGNNKKELDKL